MTSLSSHHKSILGARRRNNIFGEVSDYILSSFLALGGDGVIYNPSEQSVISLIGRTNNKLYFIRLVYEESDTEKIKVDNLSLDDFIEISKSANAEPIVAIARAYSKKCKYYTTSGNKVSSLL
ncbi:Hypothetical protein PACV_229 [Pacmanvirus A23]|uniref:Hypothetical protein n=1 Tax=Pacmanvirus A23 TaxID=1932881 RepID=UPI000A094B12|nr:Hypothetical protein B9W72_gp227 [Pacmanvirus A23]SIP85944.1 Hypothetical protein PACV_229 [Pacmanvirus A23]